MIEFAPETEFPAEPLPDQQLEAQQLLATTLIHGEVKVGRSQSRFTLELPADPAYDGIAIWTPGYLGIKQSSRQPRNAVAANNIAVLSYSPVRRGRNIWEDCGDPQKAHAETIQAIDVQLQDLQPQIDQLVGPKKVDVNKKLLLAHSMGLLAASRYANMEPGKIDMLIGLGGVGLGHPLPSEIGIDMFKGLPTLVKYELIPAIKEQHIKINMRNLREFVDYYSHLRILFEGLNCLRDDIREDMSGLKDRGIASAYLAFQHDVLVRPDQQIGDHVDTFRIMENAGHLAPIIKAKKVAGHITSLLAAH